MAYNSRQRHPLDASLPKIDITLVLPFMPALLVRRAGGGGQGGWEGSRAAAGSERERAALPPRLLVDPRLASSPSSPPPPSPHHHRQVGINIGVLLNTIFPAWRVPLLCVRKGGALGRDGAGGGSAYAVKESAPRRRSHSPP